MGRQGLERLRYFVSFVDELQERHEISKLGASLEIRLPPTGPEAKLNRPDDHLLRSFLIDARRLFTRGEDTDLDAILPLAERRIADPVARKAVTDLAHQYRQIRATSQISVSGDVLRPSELADLLIQGTIFHGNAGKRLRLDAITKGHPVAVTLVEFQTRLFVTQVVGIAIWLASVVHREDAAGRLH